MLRPDAILQRRDIDVQNRKYEVVATELRFTSEEKFKLEAAVAACDNRRRNNRDEECRLRNGVLDFAFPQRAGWDRFLVLP